MFSRFFINRPIFASVISIVIVIAVLMIFMGLRSALLIGFVLDQQVPLQKAFSGPLELRRRVGTIDAVAIAGMDPDELDADASVVP